MEGLMEFASSVPEFRKTNKGNIRHRLADIIILIVLGRASKCVGRMEIIEFGRRNLKRFRAMGMPRNGVPSEATLCRVEQGIDDLCLAGRMTDFAAGFRKELFRPDNGWEIVCVDGKVVRGTVQENGRNPDIVSAYSSDTGITLDTEACREKNNEITAVPVLLDRLDIAGCVVTADAMSMQRDIVDKIREKKGDFVIELKANQRLLRYGIGDRSKSHVPVQVFTEGPVLAHGRIETRTCRVYDGPDLIADREKWGGDLTVVEFESETVKKSTGVRTGETRLYISSLHADAAWLGAVIRRHWPVESMHWPPSCNFLQDKIKRKTTRAARNLDTLQRIVHALFAIWRGRRKKRSDKAKGIASLMRTIAMSFTRLLHFLTKK